MIIFDINTVELIQQPRIVLNVERLDILKGFVLRKLRIVYRVNLLGSNLWKRLVTLGLEALQYPVFQASSQQSA